MSKMWSLAGIWNQSLDIDKQRPYEKREHVWASELSGSYYDRYWKMQGRKPTTPPNLRAKRKFEAGNLTEWVILQVLQRAGILETGQEYIVNDNGPIRVTGKADFVAGGEIKILPEDALEGLPESFRVIAESTINSLKEKHPKGLKMLNLEIKSCSGMMFEKYLLKPGVNHGLQAFHYAHNTGRPTMLIYVSRDDFRLCEWLITPNAKKWEDLYYDDLTVMKEVLRLTAKKVDQMKEPLLLWDEEEKKYKKNFKVEYSAYLTDYGFKEASEYAEPATKLSTRINNVIKKLKKLDKITPINEKAMEDAARFDPAIQPHLSELINEWHVNYVPKKKGKK